MTRTEFIAATALILFGAFVLGWLASWLVHRIARPRKSNMTDLDRMAHQLHEAEDQHARTLAAHVEREAALRNDLARVEAENCATIEALRSSRNEIEELRDYIEQRLARR